VRAPCPGQSGRRRHDAGLDRAPFGVAAGSGWGAPLARHVETGIGQVVHVTHAARVVLTGVAVGPDEDARMSREHATVERARGGMAVVVRDGAGQADGANQTWLGGISGPVELTPTAASVEASLKQVNFDLGDDWALVVDEDAEVPSGTNAVYVND
jgi:hypothetical protein